MYVDPYEKLIHKPVERKAPTAPTVPYAKVGRQPPSPRPEPPPKQKRRGGRNREKWQLVAELYARYPTRPLSFLGRRAKMHTTSVYYALMTMGLYVKRAKPEHVAKRLYFRTVPGHVSAKKRRKQRQANLVATGKWLPSAKLNADAVRTMRRMAKEGVRTPQIARQFNVHRSTAFKAINGEHWKHVR